MTTNIVEIQNEIKKELSNKAVMDALVATTFKGLSTPNVFLAIQEGMMRGFNFKDFLEKNVYAIPFRNGYSLVTSIDYARKIGMRGGVVGVSAPTYELALDNGTTKIVSCTITIKKRSGNDIGEYSATVFFDEYNTGNNLWVTKPRTMIAKVAEMHALRKACPEEMAQLYTEEEQEKEATITYEVITPEIQEKVNGAKTLDELKAIYKENEGLGKEFAKMVTAKKKELTQTNDKA